MRYAVGIEYDGAAFCGWQKQTTGRTVQSCVEDALSRVANHHVEVICAGRTDSGVHALGQVVHFDSDAGRTTKAWLFGSNSNLPEDINLSWIVPVADTFSARFSALGRRYCYVIYNDRLRSSLNRQRTAWVSRPLNVDRMHMAGQLLLGKHDFSSYRAVSCQSKSPVREISHLSVKQVNKFIIIEVKANAFLHHMVRNIAGVLIAIGAGEKEINWTQQLLLEKNRESGGVTALPNGLYFMQVDYGEQFSQIPENKHDLLFQL